ncbi:cupredoxin domain-containing protein [Thalassotalea mangrovi]|uniref:Cupredoxin domain-containing protein n=1 Tax=Thalassotalea mangrovi TaxID=2572245 RepID=A0A4U1B501_9GAMM|nr:cupredoxin domain-containing protein [Thalassotalea mangrovi]TKB45444.1 cupredoxin domain-containing protein [Thalassotalea mangrovi]
MNSSKPGVINTISLLLLIFTFELFAKSSIKEFHLSLEQHVFSPAELTIPADEKVKLIIHNLDNEAEEFDSFDLNREKVIFPRKSAVIYVGPLPPGRYEYFGEYNPTSAKGVIVVEVQNAR